MNDNEIFWTSFSGELEKISGPAGRIIRGIQHLKPSQLAKKPNPIYEAAEQEAKKRLGINKWTPIRSGPIPARKTEHPAGVSGATGYAAGALHRKGRQFERKIKSHILRAKERLGKGYAIGLGSEAKSVAKETAEKSKAEHRNKMIAYNPERQARQEATERQNMIDEEAKHIRNKRLMIGGTALGGAGLLGTAAYLDAKHKKKQQFTGYPQF